MGPGSQPSVGSSGLVASEAVEAGNRAPVNEPAAAGWEERVLAGALLAIDPEGLGGALLHGLPGPVRDRWLSLVTGFLPDDAPLRRMPTHVSDGRLLGGLDLTATLKAGKPIREQGLLAATDGGLLVLAMAERLPAGSAGLIAAALDSGQVHLERDGFTEVERSRFGVIALDESLDDEDRPSRALRDRLAFDIDLRGLSHRDLQSVDINAANVADARDRLAGIAVDEELISALTGTAMALGIASLRAPLFAVRAAIASAALCGRETVEADDAALATRLVLAHRATCLLAEMEEDEPEPEEPPDDDPPPPEDDEGQDPDDMQRDDRPLEDQLLEAALAALPPDLLDSLRQAGAAKRSATAGNAGQVKKSGRRGRPAGVRAGKPDPGHRLSVIETLRAAAPWQPLRRKLRPHGRSARIEVRPDDFRILRQKEKTQTTAIFVVDASGSSALARLAEAKGAVELLLAECYTRRDQVALIAFRGSGADLLLPPTRSLVRAKRSLAGLPGGGGTPLAAGVQAAALLADGARRRGETPLLVFLTDGRANIALDGTPGRKQALADALAMASQASAAGGMVIDISARPGPEAAALAAALGGRYLPLPRADAKELSAMVGSAMDNEATDRRGRS